jgi:hypothetical protein
MMNDSNPSMGGQSFHNGGISSCQMLYDWGSKSPNCMR